MKILSKAKLLLIIVAILIIQQEWMALSVQKSSLIKRNQNLERRINILELKIERYERLNPIITVLDQIMPPLAITEAELLAEKLKKQKTHY